MWLHSCSKVINKIDNWLSSRGASSSLSSGRVYTVGCAAGTVTILLK